MSRLVRAVACCLTMMLAVALLATNGVQAADDDAAKAQKEILDLAQKIASGKDVAKEAGAIRKKYEDLDTVMTIFKHSDKGGVGTGLEPKKSADGKVIDGIEYKVIQLGSRKALSKAQLTKEKEKLVKIGYINAAMAEITMHYVPSKKSGGKGPKEWKQHCEDMKKSSLEFVKAINGGDPVKVKKAAENLNNTCLGCHGDFRDN